MAFGVVVTALMWALVVGAFYAFGLGMVWLTSRISGSVAVGAVI